MNLKKVRTIPDNEYYISTWNLTHEGQEVKQFIVQYPLVENGSIPFTTYLRRTAVNIARGLGYVVSAEDITIDPIDEPVDLIRMVRQIFGFESFALNN